MKKGVFILYFIGCFTSLFSQEHSFNYSVQFLGVKDGLPHRSVTCIFQDSRGFFWFGTEAGLSRYDGYELINYSTDLDSPIKLSSNTINDIEESEEGLLLVGTTNGLNILNLEEGTNKIILHLNDKEYESQGYDKSNILDLHYASDSTLWLIDGYSVSALKISKRIEILYNEYMRCPEVGGISVTGITEDKFGNILALGSDTLLGIFTMNSMHCQKENIGTYTSFFNFSNEIYLVPSYNTEPFKKVTYSQTQTHISLIDSNDILLRIPATIWKYIKENREVENIYNYKSENPYKVIKTYYIDRHNNIWVGTDFGVFVVKPIQSSFHHNNLLENFNIVAIYETKSGNKIIGNHIQLLYFDEKSNTLLSLAEKYGLEERNFIANDIIDIGDHKLLIATREQYLHIIDTLRQTITRINHPNFIHPNTWDLLVDKKDENLIWIANEGSLWQLDLRDNSLYQFKDENNQTFFKAKKVYHLIQPNQNTLWAATNFGLFEVDLRTNTVTEISIFSDQFSRPIIHFIHKASKNDYWIGTKGKGLVHWDNSLKKAILYTTRNGLPDNTIQNIMQSNDNTLWIGTHYGFSRFDIHLKQFINFYEPDGISHNEFNRGAYLKSKSGLLYFGGLNGLTFFDPKDIEKENKISEVKLASFTKYNNEKKELQKHYFSNNKPIEIFPNDKFFEFEFFLTDFSNISQNRFAYKLEDYETDWMALGTNNSVRYTNLPAGDYIFKVKKASTSSQWESTELTIPIKIYQVFYKKVWFWIVVGLVIIGIITGIYQYQINQLKKIEYLKIKLANDLHDDVGGLLTNIKLIAKLLKEKNLKPLELEIEVQRIVEMSNDAISTMSDVIWSLNTQKTRVEDLVERMQKYSDNMLGSLKIKRNFELENLNLKEKLSITIRQHVLLIFKEAIHNIIKHSHPEKVVIKVNQENRVFQMVIINYIREIKIDNTGNNKGIKSMKWRASKLGGQLDIHQDDKLFKVTFRLENLK